MTLTIAIDWADLDLFGHVNNVAFFRFMQTARVALCEKAGLDSLNSAGKPGFMVASSKCDFRKPLKFPGAVTIECRIGWLRNTSFQVLYSLGDAGSVAVGEDVLVVFDHAKGSKMMIPGNVRQALESLSQRAADDSQIV